MKKKDSKRTSQIIIHQDEEIESVVSGLTKGLKQKADEASSMNEIVKFKRFLKQNTFRESGDQSKHTGSITMKPESSNSLIDLISDTIK